MTNPTKAVRVEDGRYTLFADGELVGQSDYRWYDTAAAAYADAALIWPADSAWNGRRVPGGYRINI